MKRILFLLTITLPLVFTSCSKDDESGEQTFFVNVYQKWDGKLGDTNWGESEETLAEKAFVYLYENNGKIVDNDKSAMSVVTDGVITYSDGSRSSQPTYATKTLPGIFNMENIKNGEYILWVTYLNYSVSYSSYKKINVNHDYRGKGEKKVFLTSSNDTGLYRFQNW